jgi:hypothetical protein
MGTATETRIRLMKIKRVALTISGTLLLVATLLAGSSLLVAFIIQGD